MTPAGPRISCLMPVYNGERFLAEAVDSILAQTMGDFELVVVNDGSTDRTAEILARYAGADPRVRVVDRPNGGIVAALNTGLAVCRGEFVARMDADDVSLPERFAFQTAYLDRHPGCVLVGGLASTRPDGGGPGTSGGRHRRTDLSRFPPRIAVSMHPLITVRRAALVAAGGYRDDYPHAEDYDLFIRLARHGTIDNPDRAMLFYRRHEDAISLRHLETQEASAARAEADAVRAAGRIAVGDDLVAAYTGFRIWRRYLSIAPDKARAMQRRLIADACGGGRAVLTSPAWWRLRAMILAGLIRAARRGLSRRGATRSPPAASRRRRPR